MGIKSTGLSLARGAVYSGIAHLDSVRGSGTWGANWVFHSGGVQNDIRLVFDEFKNLSTSGAFATDAEVAAAISVVSGYASSGMSTYTLGLNSNISVMSGYMSSGMSTYTLGLNTNVNLLSGYIASGMNTFTRGLNSNIDLLSGYISSGMSTYTLGLNTNIEALSGYLASDVEVYAVSGNLRDAMNSISGAIATGGYIQSGTLNDMTLYNCDINGYIYPFTSGSLEIGSNLWPMSSGGIYAKAGDNGAVMKLVIYSNGLVSGVAV